MVFIQTKTFPDILILTTHEHDPRYQIYILQNRIIEFPMVKKDNKTFLIKLKILLRHQIHCMLSRSNKNTSSINSRTSTRPTVAAAQQP